MPDSTQISSRSSASGKARRIESWRFAIRFFRNRHGSVQAHIGGEEAGAELDHRWLLGLRSRRRGRTRRPANATIGVTIRKNRNVMYGACTAMAPGMCWRSCLPV